MHRVVIIILLAVLALGFVGTTYAAYNGVGLVTSGNTNTTSSRGVFFIFPGGGPGGAGK